MMMKYAARTDTEIWGLGYSEADALRNAMEESGADSDDGLMVSRITPAFAYEVIQNGSPKEWRVLADGKLDVLPY